MALTSAMLSFFVRPGTDGTSILAACELSDALVDDAEPCKMAGGAGLGDAIGVDDWAVEAVGAPATGTGVAWLAEFASLAQAASAPLAIRPKTGTILLTLTEKRVIVLVVTDSCLFASGNA
jgi:hypothetical protein